MVAAGPLSRNAEDLAPMLKVLIGPNVTKLRLDEPVDLKNLNIYYQESAGDLRMSKVSKTMQETLMKAVQHFKELTGSATKVEFHAHYFIL